MDDIAAQVGDLYQLRRELERLKANPIRVGDTFITVGEKMLAATDLCLRVAERQIAKD